MAFVGSWGNRREAKTNGTRRKYIVLTSSICMCLIGAISLYVSIGDAWHNELQPPPSGQEQKASETQGPEEQPIFGQIASILPQAEPEPTQAETAAAPEAATPEELNTGQDQSPAQESRSASDAGRSWNSTSSTTRRAKVHHTALVREPVYKTVHHPASTLQASTKDGTTTSSWSLCPICKQRHDVPYDEKVVDYYRELACTTCGGRHEEAYDE